ncbi:MAG: hypothetical protein AAF665_03495 [Pseudomonadota bacterium]
MGTEWAAGLAFGAIIAFALVMLLRERRAMAARRAARGGRDVDVGKLIALGSQAGEGAVTHGAETQD